MAEQAALARMYKLIKTTRLLRILKIIKERSKILRYLNEFLKISMGVDRLVFFTMIFFILCHIISCLWVTGAQFGEAMYDG